MGSKRAPNRIINNEGHLGGYQSALEGILASPEHLGRYMQTLPGRDWDPDSASRTEGYKNMNT